MRGFFRCRHARPPNLLNRSDKERPSSSSLRAREGIFTSPCQLTGGLGSSNQRQQGVLPRVAFSLPENAGPSPASKPPPILLTRCVLLGTIVILYHKRREGSLLRASPTTDAILLLRRTVDKGGMFVLSHTRLIAKTGGDEPGLLVAGQHGFG